MFNTIQNLTTQDEQVACSRNAAAHLGPGGHLVLGVEVPDPPRRADADRHRVVGMSADQVDVDEFVDRIGQIVVSHHVRPHDDRARVVSGRCRHVWPAELNLMARLAGMERVERWADWYRAPLGDDATSHVSVWRLAG